MKRNVIAVISVVSIATGVFFIPITRVTAQPIDCETERCAIQGDIDAECSCAEAKNHGRYTSCVARVVNRAARAGTIDKKCRNAINGCAIRSTCGKREGVVLCDQAGDGVSGRCRPLSSEAICLKRGGEVVSSCCGACAVEPTPTATSTAPSPTPTPGAPAVTATEFPGSPTVGAATATPEEPVATPTEGAVPTSTPETPDATATPAGTGTPEATATVETPVATATPEVPVATATVEPPVATATPEEPSSSPTPTPITIE